jgi:hypothetical protein
MRISRYLAWLKNSEMKFWSILSFCEYKEILKLGQVSYYRVTFNKIYLLWVLLVASIVCRLQMDVSVKILDIIYSLSSYTH